ncbi:MAG TPA: hypothetical protein VMZ52_14160 [Bryobacteraceae bacterium]|nr:hypothetical protein [Bryobacteraceae bacterium]
MKNIWVVAVAAGILTIPAAGQDIQSRGKEQQERIATGVASGQLTRTEARKLEREQAKIRRDVRKAHRSGGRISARERAKISREQNKSSRRIYREKHDSQGR